MLKHKYLNTRHRLWSGLSARITPYTPLFKRSGSDLFMFLKEESYAHWSSICLITNIYYSQCWKQLCCLIFYLSFGDKFFPGFFDEWKVQKNSIYLKYKDIINVFTATFDQFNASLLNKNVDFSFLSVSIIIFEFYNISIYIYNKAVKGTFYCDN